MKKELVIPLGNQAITALLCLLFFLTPSCSYLKQRHLIARGGTYHQVKRGDTLFKLSQRYKVPVDDIFAANLLESKDEIFSGQQLFIPSAKLITAAHQPAGKEVSQSKLAKQKKRHKTKKLKRKRTPSKRKTARKTKVPGKSKKQKTRARKNKKTIVFRWPLKGIITSRFGLRRNKQKHNGLDIAARKGTKIRAAAGGKVIYADDKLRYYGKVIILKNAGNWFTVYAHNSKNLVHEGELVKQGAIIGYVGATGRATGPHLHFEIRQGQKTVNPLHHLPKR